ncbi:hypothetical protein ALQ30_05663 [Pseudomonas syringae pv. persicae]|uniref:Uncharacterized protein n=1 Tax=Pseudomonas syringae pv. persicae TaxID=237306 RepID=A0A3M4AAL1_9PSED|nr:hypothetical protein ALQ30_05663 [Pseudomonas syringae pv. persicae]
MAFFRIDAELGDGFRHHFRFDIATIRQSFQSCQHNEVTIDFKEVTQLLAAVATAETVGAQDFVFLGWNPLTNLVSEQLHVIRRCNDRTFATVEALLNIAQFRLLARVQAVVALYSQTVATQFVEAGNAPDVSADVELVTENLRRFANFTQDGARAQQLDVVRRFPGVFFEQVHTLDDAFFRTGRHGWLGVGLVHHGQVVENVLLLFEHPAHAVLDDHCQLVTVSRVEGAAVRDGRRQNVAVTVFVLQAFAVQRGTAGGAADQETTGAAVASSPCQVADTLETEHRVEDVERNHRLVVAGIRSTGSDEGGHGARFVDAFLENLAFLVFAIEHHLFFIDWLVELADRRVDAQLAEHAFHTEGTRFVRDDRHDALTDFLVLDQLRQDAHESHGGGDFTVARTVKDGLEGIEWRRRQAEALRATLRYEATQRSTTLAQVTGFGAAFFRLVERQGFEFGVLDRDVETVTEVTQAVDIDLLGVVCSVFRFAGAGAITFDGFGQNHGRLTLVVDGFVVGRINLVRVVAATVEFPDLVVGQIGNHCLEFRRVEEVLADERAVLGLVVLVFAVDDFVHATLQDTVDVLGQQWVPETAPDDFGDVPLSTTEHAFQFLNDLGVAANRAVEALQVAVDDEDQVVELLATGQSDGAQGFRLVGLAVTQEAPDFLLAFRDVTTVLQVLHEARLVDRLDRAKAHRYSRELPEILHQPRVWVRRQAIAVDFLTEVVHLVFGDAAFEERTGINAWRCVTLEVDQVAAVLVGRGLEEVVEADVVQRCAGGEAGDVAAQIRVVQVGFDDHCQCVPAHQRANAAFHEQVARHACFVGDRNRVAVWRSDGVRQLRTTTGGQLAQTGHQVVSAVFAFFVENRFQGVQPFLGFDGIEVLHGLLQGGKASRIGCLSLRLALWADDINSWITGGWDPAACSFTTNRRRFQPSEYRTQ